jgi:hypothetical protein
VSQRHEIKYIFSQPFVLTTVSPLSLDTSYEKLRAEVRARYRSFVTEQAVILRA